MLMVVMVIVAMLTAIECSKISNSKYLTITRHYASRKSLLSARPDRRLSMMSQLEARVETVKQDGRFGSK